MNDTNTLPTSVYQHSYRDCEMGQNLRELVDTPVLGTRPVQPKQFERISYVGGQTFKVRRPDIGETGLSESEIDHAMTYGVSA